MRALPDVGGANTIPLLCAMSDQGRAAVRGLPNALQEPFVSMLSVGWVGRATIDVDDVDVRFTPTPKTPPPPPLPQLTFDRSVVKGEHEGRRTDNLR